jgi:hypothetical protein
MASLGEVCIEGHCNGKAWLGTQYVLVLLLPGLIGLGLAVRKRR